MIYLYNKVKSYIFAIFGVVIFVGMAFLKGRSAGKNLSDEKHESEINTEKLNEQETVINVMVKQDEKSQEINGLSDDSIDERLYEYRRD